MDSSESSVVHPASEIQGNFEEMISAADGPESSTIPLQPQFLLNEDHLSPVLLEIFTSLRSADSGQLEQDLRNHEQGQAWQGISGNVSVIALVYRVSNFDPTCGVNEVDDPLNYNRNWTQRQRMYTMTKTPHIVVNGIMSIDNIRILACVTPGVPRSLSLPVQEAQFQFYRRKCHLPSCPSHVSIHFSFTLDLRFMAPMPGMLIMVALYETEAVSTFVTGPNTGLNITRRFVVKDLTLADAVDLRYSIAVVAVQGFLKWEGFTSNRCGIVVFLQYEREIRGAKVYPLKYTETSSFP